MLRGVERADEELEAMRRRLAESEELLRRAMLEKGAMVLQRLEEEKRRAIERADLARRDLGTGLLRHGAFRRRLAFEVARARRTGDPLALLLADLDRFGEFNERCGYEAGDQALAAIARSLEALWIARPGPRPCVLGREGGDRFAILLPAADRAEAEQRAEGARELIERLPLGPPRLTASIGGAVTPGASASAAALLAAAGARLAEVRREGGNRCAIAGLEAQGVEDG